MNKRTHEEYVAELAIKNPAVNVVEKYINASTPILHRCIVHNVLWQTTPARALSGCGCSECKKIKFKQARQKTHQQYVEEIRLINSNLSVIEEYAGATTPILHQCNLDGHIWRAYPDNVLHGHGCPKCRDRMLREQQSKTQEQYENDVAKLHPTIKVLGKYVNSEVAILHMCLIDGYTWMAKPGNILAGKGCSKCAGNIKLTNAEYVQRLKNSNPNITPLELYVDMKTPILHKCLVDGHIWNTTPSSTMQGCGCPKCAGNLKKTHDEYVSELLTVNADIEVLEQYINAKTPILHRCKIDNYQWRIAPSNVLSGQGCPACQETKGEKQIRQWLELHGFAYNYQYKFAECKDKKSLPFDFFLSEYNLCIEYDGIQHFEPVDFAGDGEEWAIKQFAITQQHDKIKTDYCNDNRIRLLRISYFEDVDEILNNYLLNIVTQMVI